MAKTELLHFKHNVHEHCGKEVARVQGDIDKEVFDYFFHHVLAWAFGTRQVLVNFFFQRLYEECQAQGIPPVWDEGNDAKLLTILNNLNFNGSKPRKPRNRPASTRRTDSPPLVHQGEPDGIADVGSKTDRND